ncbi:MAG: OsmC family protein [Gemmatimonadetes bacterium]|nr:OsmC family protein [Gemmatimonadota bacterium]
MLEARGIDASGGKLTSDVQGKFGKEEGVLGIRHIHVKYLLQAAGADPAAVQRAFDLHPMRCPVYRTLHKCIEITTELAVV